MVLVRGQVQAPVGPNMSLIGVEWKKQGLKSNRPVLAPWLCYLGHNTELFHPEMSSILKDCFEDQR